MSARDIAHLAGRAVAIGALAVACASACSNGDPAPGGGGAGTGGSTAWTCQQIRTCVFDCTSDTCLQGCAAKGSADAQTKFEALRACTAKTCTPDTDVNCECAEQCLDGGSCFAEVEACLAGATQDLICDSALCH
jgi:hypothetical protein